MSHLDKRSNARPHVVGLRRIEDIVEFERIIGSLKPHTNQISHHDTRTLSVRQLLDPKAACCNNLLLGATQEDE